MRIDAIRLNNFLSHEATSFELHGARLVTLVGANGAGKSSLLDGVQYALYDSARAKTDDLVRLGSSEMSATIEFAFAGARYRVTRGRTTRSGGKSYLELAVAHGDDDWRPLTGDTIRETQLAIAALLRLDAETFATAVLLGQGQAARFAEATPAERKRVLGVILGLDRYERAEAKARELVRGLEATTAAERDRLERLEQTIALDIGIDEILSATDAELATNADAMQQAASERQSAEERLRGLAASIADIEAAEADVRRIGGEIDGHKARWHRAAEARATAESALVRHRAALERAPEVEAAVAKLEATRADVGALEAAERHHADRQRGLEEAQAIFREVEAAHERAVAEHEAMRVRLADREAALTEQVDALEPVTCPRCDLEFAADPAGLKDRLITARLELDQAGEPPEAPLRIARERAKVARAESALREAPFDPAELATKRQELLALERVAATAGELEAHRVALADAETHAQAAAEESMSIEAEGKAARAALATAQARVAQGETVRAQRTDAQGQLTAAVAAATSLEAKHQELTAARARAQAQLEQRDARIAERDEVRLAIDQAETEILLLRRLVVAFGRDGIPARIIESVLPELTGYVDELLAELRPGMTLAIRAQRAKKSGTGVVEALDLVVRDDAGERPLGLYSGGERMSVSLALAVGLSRLVARRAGSRIESLIVDEPDGLDADSRRALGHALKVLSHRGDLERIIVVTHTPDLAEFGDAVYQVSRDGDGSHVELVA